MSAEYIFPVQMSLLSLLKKELGTALPQTKEISYWDFLAGEEKTVSVALPAIRNFYAYPTSLEAEYPFCSVLISREGFQDGTQQAQDELHDLEIQFWELLYDLEQIHFRLECYAAITENILSANEDIFRTKNSILRLKPLEHRYSLTLRTDEGFIRPVHIPITVEMIETI